MVRIGRVRKGADGVFRGAITLPGGSADIEIVSKTSMHDEARIDYRVFARGREIGDGSRNATMGENKVPLMLEGAGGERSIEAVLKPAEGSSEPRLFDIVIETS